MTSFVFTVRMALRKTLLYCTSIMVAVKQAIGGGFADTWQEVIFCFVKVMNNLASRTEKLLKKEEEAPAAPATKICPYCMSEIPIAATRCAYCTSELPAEDTDKEE